MLARSTTMPADPGRDLDVVAEVDDDGMLTGRTWICVAGGWHDSREISQNFDTLLEKVS